jgi:hypothetical protein
MRFSGKVKGVLAGAPEDNRKTRVLARVWPIWLPPILADFHVISQSIVEA